MGFIDPSPPPMEYEEWSRRSHLERIKVLAQDWALNGFGTPVGRQMQAVSQARQRMDETGAEEILFVSDGDDPASEEAPAVFSVLLRELPHRLINGQTAAVLPMFCSATAA